MLNLFFTTTSCKLLAKLGALIGVALAFCFRIVGFPAAWLQGGQHNSQRKRRALLRSAGVLFIASLTGCGTYNTIISERGASAADDLMVKALYAVCQPQTIGAVRRKFSTPESRADYDAFCEKYDGN